MASWAGTKLEAGVGANDGDADGTAAVGALAAGLISVGGSGGVASMGCGFRLLQPAAAEMITSKRSMRFMLLSVWAGGFPLR